MSPVGALPVVLLSPATGDPRAAQPPSPPEASARGADPGAADAFGRAFGEAMKELDNKASPGAERAGARGDQGAADAPPAAAAATDPAAAAPVPTAPMPPPGLPAGLPAAAGDAAREAVVGAVNGGVAAIAGPVPTGKDLPPGDEALPRHAPAVPATASGGASDALARPAAAVPAVASAAPSAAGAVAAPATAAAGPGPGTQGHPGRDVAAANPELRPSSPPGARADMRRQGMPAPARVSRGPAVADAQPLPQGVPAAAPKPDGAPPLPLAAVDAGTLRRREAAVAAAGDAGGDAALPAADEAFTGLAQAVAVAAPAANPPSADAGVPGSARPASSARRAAPVQVSAAAAPAVSVPVAGSSVGAAREPFAGGGDAATDLLVPRATLLRPGSQPAPSPGEQQGAPGPTRASEQGADHGATPWLQALAQARELAVEPESPSPERDGAGPLPVGAAERPGGAAMTLPLPAAGLAGMRAEPGPGAGILALPLAVGHAPAQWASELEARVQWLAGRNLGAAEIRLDPPELGPLQVQVQAHRDGASVHFTTHSAAVRDLVEQSLPRLREMLESGGMSLVDVNVAQQQGGRGERDALPASPGGAGVARDSESPATVATVAVTARGLVDAYA